MKVIVRSNENAPYWVGELLRFDTFGLVRHANGRARDKVPVVKNETGEEMFCGGCVLPYSKELAWLLDNMEPKDQFAWCCAFSQNMAELHLERQLSA
jgi:hypothetical protein